MQGLSIRAGGHMNIPDLDFYIGDEAFSTQASTYSVKVSYLVITFLLGDGIDF